MSTVRAFSDFSEEWIQFLRPQVKESTFNKYRNLLNSYINPKLGNAPPTEISCGDIERLCGQLLREGGVKKNGLSNKTVSAVLSVVRRVLHYVSTHYGLQTCDAGSVRVKHSGHEMRVLSRGEQEKLCIYLTETPGRFNVGIMVCLFTGLRIGEICGLRWEDISLEERTLSVRRTIQRIQNVNSTGPRTTVIISSPKSANSRRTIPIPDNIFPIICEHKKVDRGYFLTNSDKKFAEPRLVQLHFKRAIDECGIDSANFHALRHTFATRCVELGMDVKSLSEILGHSSVSITMDRYVHPSMELKRENMNRLSALFEC